MNILEKKETKIAAVAVMILLVIILVITLFWQNNLKQTKNSLEHEAGQELTFEAKDYFDVDEETAKAVAFDVSNVNADVVGEYKAIAKYKSKEYTIKVNVVDTKAPRAEVAARVLFTNDIVKQDTSALLASVEELSEYTTKFIRFEKKDVLSAMDTFAVKKLEEAISDFRTKDEALAVGTEEIPTQPGIYRSVLEIADVHGNAVYKEVYVVLDKTGAIINDVEDMVVSVPADKLGEKPVLDMTLYKGYDEVDGTLNSDNLAIEVSLKDETKHEWTVAVSYTDRAGNESKSEFLITVEEEQQQIVVDNTQKPNDDTNTNETTESSNQGSIPTTPDNTPSNKPSDNGNTGNNNTGNSDTEYDPRDTNKDGTVSGDEEMMYITPEKQACIDAGYGVVVKMDGGEWYAVLMKSNEHTIDGKNGRDILREYLNDRGLDGHISGCWINGENEWYWYSAREIYELPDDYVDPDDIIWGEIEDF